VFIGNGAHFAVAPELEEHAVRLMRSGDAAGAMRALAAPVRDGLEAAARVAERPGDVYNSGAALSQDALEAFLAEATGTGARVARRVTVAPAQIPDPLRARWFYGEEPLSLVACFHPDGRLGELFRRVGVASFKGLGDVTIWELCEGPAPTALAGALAAEWFSSSEPAPAEYS
jgi:hypothetical protein